MDIKKNRIIKFNWCNKITPQLKNNGVEPSSWISNMFEDVNNAISLLYATEILNKEETKECRNRFYKFMERNCKRK